VIVGEIGTDDAFPADDVAWVAGAAVRADAGDAVEESAGAVGIRKPSVSQIRRRERRG